jgi:organic hydroperoxide reductase OsmC/OhrA
MEHTARIEWSRGAAAFLDQKYPRAHRWRFDGGAVVAGSSSPHVVPVPQSDPAAVDPEEAFVASLASCRGFVVDGYADDATGTMARVAKGRLAITAVVLRPRVRFQGAAPDAATHEAMHREAHEACFIANSVKSEVRVLPALA